MKYASRAFLPNGDRNAAALEFIYNLEEAAECMSIAQDKML